MLLDLSLAKRLILIVSMRLSSLSLSALLLTPCLSWALTTEVNLSFVPVPESATRAEVRATNASGTLLAGNLQYAPVDGPLQSEPVFWVKSGDSWERKSLPGITAQEGFYTFSDINSGSQDWLVGRAWSGTKVEGYAHNYVSGETIWGGVLQPDLESLIGSIFTGASSDGLLFCGTAYRNNQLSAPVIYDRNLEALEEVPVPEGFDGGWLYVLNGPADSATGVGFLNIFDAESSSIIDFPARWTREEGLVPLPVLAEGKGGTILKMSSDGSTALGLAYNELDEQLPTIWHLDQGGQPEALFLPAGPGYLYGEANTMDSASGWISGSVFYDNNPEDEIPGDWRGVVWDTNRIPRLASDFIKDRYGVDLSEVNIRSCDWLTGGGGLTASYTDVDGRIKVFTVALRARAAGFEFLDPMPGGQYYAEARGISDDGSRVAGLASGYPLGTVPALWTLGQGWQHLPVPEAVQFTDDFLPASDISPDGQFIVGRSPSDKGTPVGFVWNNGQSSFHRLTDEEGTYSRLTGISHDGSIAVGQSAIPGSLALHAMVVRDGVPSALSYPGEASTSWAYDVSGDGQLAAGWAGFPDFSSIPLLWTVATGDYEVLPVPEGGLAVDLLAMSEDGSIIVGATYFFVGDLIYPRPTYWDADRNPVLIPNLGEFQYGSAWSVSADGSMIVGQMLNADYTEGRGFIHQPGGSTRDLHAWYLEEHQVYLDQDYKPTVLYVSANGKWFSGSGPDPLVADSRLAFRIKVPEKTAEDSFGEDAIAINDTGWVQTWFGLVKDELYPLVYHQYHGWLEMSVWGPDGGYFYDANLGWIFVERGSYPLMNLLPSDGASKWVFYKEGTASPRRFYDYEKQQWVTEDQF